MRFFGTMTVEETAEGARRLLGHDDLQPERRRTDKP
jgi:hypothetical protein